MPFSTSHTRTVLSREPDTMNTPTGKNATELTTSSCPSNVLPIVAWVFTLHSRMVLSHEPEAILVPSGENVTDVTGSRCPSSGLPIKAPVFESHILTV